MDLSALDWLERFHRHLVTERRLSPNTVKSYLLDLAALVTYCDKQQIPDWAALKVADVRSHAARAHAAGLSPVSVQRLLSAVRTFMKFLIREGVVRANVAVLVQAPRAGRSLPKVLDADQMQRLIEIAGTDVLAIRDRAIMELFYSSALRLAELIALDRHDVDLQDRTVRVLGKGNSTRIVPVGSYAIRAIRQWLGIRAKIAKNRTQPALFVGRNGRRLSRRGVQVRIAYWGGQQGIGIHVHPHMFRHSCATHFLESSGSIRDTQELLGHACISTTQIYTHLDAQYLIKVYGTTHPRAHRKTP